MAEIGRQSPARRGIGIPGRLYGSPTGRVLAVLHGAGEVTLGELSSRCPFKQSTMTKIVDRLETQGLVARVNGVDDRRRRFVGLSERGRLEVGGSIEEARLLSGYTADQAGLLQGALRDLIDHCSAEGPQEPARKSYKALNSGEFLDAIGVRRTTLQFRF